MADIVLDGVNKRYGEKTVLPGVSFAFAEGRENAVFGASGCGKTTLLRLISGLETPDGGSITGTEGKKISFLFQEDRLFPWLSALDNVNAVCKNKDLAKELLFSLGLGEGDIKKYPSELSGGMNRRVSIARSLAYGGDIFLFDEPLRGLDEKSAENAKAVIKKYTEGKTVITVTHDISHVREMNGKTLFL